MFNLSSNEYITLRSSASSDLFSNTPYDFTNQLCTTLTFSNKTKVALSELHLTLNFRAEIDGQSKIKQIFILSDIVDDSIVGSSRLNILKVISVDIIKFATNTQVILFDNLFFYSLARNSINNIRIVITDTFGNILHPGTLTPLTKLDETFIVLKFK